MTSYRYDILPLLSLVIFVNLYLLHFMGLDLSLIFGNLGDGRLNNFFLENGYRFINGEHESFWNSTFFYPAENVMTYSDNHMGTLPFYALFRVLGFDIETSYQLWSMVIFSLNAISAYIVLRLFRFDRVGSFFGALLFSVSAPVMIKTEHIQLMPRFMIPVIFFSGIKYVQTLQLKYFYLFCFAFVSQFYIGIYIGFFSLTGFILLMPFAIYFLVKNKNIKSILSTSHMLKIFLAALVSLLFLYLLFEPYLAAKETIGGRSWNEILLMLPRLESWVYTKGNIFIPFLNNVGHQLPVHYEHFMFIGFIPWISLIAVLAILFFKKRVDHFLPFQGILLSSVSVIVLVFLFTLVVSDGFTLYKETFYSLPGFDSIRAVVRIILFLTFPFAVLCAFLITYINTNIPNRPIKTLLLLSVISIGVAEQYRDNRSIGTYNKHDAQERYTHLYEKIKEPYAFDFFYYSTQKPSSGFYIDELDAMYLSLLLNKPTINGYSGNGPVGYKLWKHNNYFQWLRSNHGSISGRKILVFDGKRQTILYTDDMKSKNATPAEKALKNYSFSIKPLATRVVDDKSAEVLLKVTNTSANTWPSIYRGKYGIALSYRIENSHKKIKTGFDSRIFLPYDVEPGVSIELPITVKGLGKGENIITFSMVQELIAWFHDKSSNPLFVKININ